MSPSDVLEAYESIVGEPLTRSVALEGGRNSRVEILTTSSGARYVGKTYFPRSDHGEDALGVEFGALTFLHRNCVENVPKPIGLRKHTRCAVYEYVDGTPAAAGMVSTHEIDAVVAFVRTLHSLRTAPGASQVGPAAEAFTTLEDLQERIETRQQRLLVASTETNTAERELIDFLNNEFMPVHQHMSDDVVNQWLGAGWSIGDQTPSELLTLSPSDFGLHNALRNTGNQIVFVDFEYFGWDDPAKLISDFLLHPGMELNGDLKRRFLSQTIEIFAEDPELETRTRLLHPLFCLKWCLILLNEYLPGQAARRGFAASSPGPSRILKARQLIKARHMLDRVGTVCTWPPDVS